MRAVRLHAKWDPRPEFKLGPKDIEGKLTWLGSKVWRYPEVRVEEVPEPRIEKPTEIIIKVKACGICGSDVHMAQTDEEGYILYPGLTGFPVTLGHEFSGVVVEAGPEAINRRTNKRFEIGEPVCAEEMLWCGHCRPCAEGFPNHCENLNELGFNVDGAFAEYVKVDAKYAWSLRELEGVYEGDRLFLAGSLVEPTSVAYNAVIVRGGGIRPGDNVVILGGGPIGLAAVAILKHAGASKVILSEPSEVRRNLAKELGADHVIDPTKENFVEAVLDYTNGLGAKLFLEATGVPQLVWPQIEEVIWRARGINATVAIVARADAKIPLTGEVFQVRRAQIVGSQGHSGHGTFPRVISLMASGMDMTKIISKTVSMEEIPEYIKRLQTDKSLVKVTMLNE
ncbi:alcohol dehydrogenase [Thermotoga maritima MSB8]|uniref:Scyllo-inosose 3-dehydrogenase n=1 Tax=Thermotoga maritima (strain ATCC 43589 / DSM 3109 / JCM 10099 / NBRC 100826 / MSB8) TaxID=243274 RepID=IOLM_THEMA|nr:scyllo-inosose 3-dehydrogenase [Thermotoga maritima]Q9WYP3.1 RecName: Full=Scyllo-inosose 3-dehydrogenase; AltName: Full=2-keto-myo-inositol dehydrogenase [Thermotoga maritima MSB8]AAD35497.1 alcohol dehydrogenase, zinc-containing [Thermotoga maritima MSB8]AGL49334.1 L-threonine 3-dehydrogenase [Thermotoga maritima MSB8]AHD17830.1 alcohol dehydrogenase [Thermotoga maritima MSB8]AKE26342.1 alcohol dehydrogenase [Thermotoga maritima]AKE28206.1 alcohol dehydrogenase [Thermotoga maritima MSB8]